MLYRFFFSLVILIIKLFENSFSLNPSDKIKECNFTTHCPEIGKEFSIDISFNRAPQIISEGEIIKFSDSKIRLSSSPTLSKDKKIVTYKFTPELLGKYYFVFNKNLICPDNNIIIAKKIIGLTKITGSLYLTEKYLISEDEKIDFNIDMEFNETFIYGEDIKNIYLVQKSNNNERSEELIQPTNCITSNKNHLKCYFHMEKGFNYKTKTKALTVFYYNRCNESLLFGHISVFKSFNEKNNFLTSYLSTLKLYLMSEYKKEQKMLLLFVYDPKLKTHKNFIENSISIKANEYPQWEFNIMEWEEAKFITDHFGVKDIGYIQIIIMDFSNENEFTDIIKDEKDLDNVLEKLNKYTLKWTSQSLMQRIFTFFRIKMNKDEETKFNFRFGVIGFILFVALRCFLFAKKMARDQANLQVNPNPKKTN